jgi:hypothetical protein
MFSSNIVRGMQLKHTWSLTFYDRRFLNFKIYLWIWDSPELIKCGIKAFKEEQFYPINCIFFGLEG